MVSNILYLGKEVGIVIDPEINEASGLVASQTYSNVFWTLNDSGILQGVPKWNVLFETAVPKNAMYINCHF